MLKPAAFAARARTAETSWSCISMTLPHLLADQELRGVGVSVAVVLCAVGGAAGDTADKGGKPLHTVDQAVLEQEIERPIDRGRGCTAPGLAQLVEQVIGAGRRCRIQDHAEDVPAQFRQPGTAMLADRFGAIQQVLGPS